MPPVRGAFRWPVAKFPLADMLGEEEDPDVPLLIEVFDTGLSGPSSGYGKTGNRADRVGRLLTNYASLFHANKAGTTLLMDGGRPESASGDAQARLVPGLQVMRINGVKSSIPADDEVLTGELNIVFEGIDLEVELKENQFLNPYLAIYKGVPATNTEAASWDTIHFTEVCVTEGIVRWGDVTLDLADVGTMEHPLLIECLHYFVGEEEEDEIGDEEPVLVGSAQTTLKGLTMRTPPMHVLVNSEKLVDPAYSNSGKLRVVGVQAPWMKEPLVGEGMHALGVDRSVPKPVPIVVKQEDQLRAIRGDKRTKIGRASDTSVLSMLGVGDTSIAESTIVGEDSIIGSEEGDAAFALELSILPDEGVELFVDVDAFFVLWKRRENQGGHCSASAGHLDMLTKVVVSDIDEETFRPSWRGVNLTRKDLTVAFDDKTPLLIEVCDWDGTDADCVDAGPDVNRACSDVLASSGVRCRDGISFVCVCVCVCVFCIMLGFFSPLIMGQLF